MYITTLQNSIRSEQFFFIIKQKGVFRTTENPDGQTYSFPIEIIPCKRPLLPPKTGSKANSKPTAQS